SEAYHDLYQRTRLLALLILLTILFVGAGMAWFYHYRQRNIYMELYRNKRLLHESQEKLKATLYSIGDGVISTNLDGKIMQLNKVAEKLTGWFEKEAKGKKADEVFKLINEDTLEEIQSPVDKVLKEGRIVGLANHTLLVQKNGEHLPIADSGAPIKDESGKLQGVVMVFRDQSVERLNQKTIELRLNLIDFAATHNDKEILQKAIDDICAFMKSPLGFINFVDEDKQTVQPKIWSSYTLEKACKIDKNTPTHYKIEHAGIWAEAIRQRKPVIHNNFQNEKNIEKLPDGHPKITRELVVPVFRNKKIVAVMGIGNKEKSYTQTDINTLNFLADITWTITEVKRKESDLKESEERYRLVLDNSIDAILLTNPNGDILSANKAACNMFQMSEDEICNAGRKGLVDLDDKRLPEFVKKREEKGSIQAELTFIRKNGEKFPADFSSSIFYTSKGEKRTSLIIRDISKRKKSEQIIREERLLLRTLINTLSDAIYVKDKQGRKLLANKAYLDMMGVKSEDEIKGKTDLDLFPAETGQKGYREDMEVINDGKIFFNSEDCYSDLNGNKRWRLISKTPIRNENNQITGLVGFSHDYTSLKETDQKLRENKQTLEILYDIALSSLSTQKLDVLLIKVRDKLSKVIDTTNFFVATYNHVKETLNKVIFVNEKYTIDEWSIHNSLSGDVIKSQKTIFLNAPDIQKIAKKHKKRPEYVLAKSWLGVPLIDQQEVIGVMVVQNYEKSNVFNRSHARLLEMVAHELVIVIQRTRMIEDVIKAKEEAEKSDRLKSAFLANISHEIRTPMNGILGFLDLLNDRDINEKEKSQYLEIMNKSGQKLLETINDIIEISKLESGQVDVNISTVNTEEVMNDQYLFFKQQASNKNLELILEGHLEGNKALVKTDKFKIDAILTNILNNAIKYTQTGNICFGNYLKDNNIIFYVKDTGIGIPPEKMEAIFERFIQDDQYISRPQEGVGLGLSIVKGYIEMLDGKIWVDSAPEKGSTFYISIPYRQ
ncbi:MAG TPA: PAS domain S-box protein, partial [Prolixibacteraceae bacterium]|nr:PAS domain S-box protein [Prolixibacteraceae bacterium]